MSAKKEHHIIPIKKDGLIPLIFLITIIVLGTNYFGTISVSSAASITTLSDGSVMKDLTFTEAGMQTVSIKIPKTATVVYTQIGLTSAQIYKTHPPVPPKKP